MAVRRGLRARVFVILALVLPFGLAPVISTVICRGVGHELAGWLAWIAWLAEPAPPSGETARTEQGEPDQHQEEAPGIESVVPESIVDPTSPIDSGSGRTKAAMRGRQHFVARPAREAQQVARPLGIVVSADVVRSAIPPNARPSGVLVQPTSSRPGGVEVRAAGILGGYLQPGDVVIEAEGQRIVSWGTLVGVVTQAYARHADSIHGKLWRGGRDVNVTVHLPYDSPLDARGRGTK